jgi:hypothetical protein
MKMQDRKNVQLATALAAVLGISMASAAKAQNADNSIFQVREATLIAQADTDTVKVGDENKASEASDKGKEGSCKGKEGSCKGKEGSCKGKEGKAKAKEAKGKEGSCKGKEGSCKGKEGSCKSK